MDILGMLGSLARQAPRAVATYREGQREGEAERFDTLQQLKAQAERAQMLRMQQERQAEQDEIDRRYKEAMIGRTEALNAPKPAAPERWAPRSMEEAVEYQTLVAQGRQRARPAPQGRQVAAPPSRGGGEFADVSGGAASTAPVVQAGGGGGRVAPAPRSDDGKAPTVDQANAAQFAARMLTAEDGIGVVGMDGLPTGKTETLGRVPLVGGAFLTDKQQQFRQYKDDWIRAKLRKESGATIGDEERATEEATYFPQPTDSPALIAQKVQRRKLAAQLMKSVAGRGWTPEMDEIVKQQAALLAGQQGGGGTEIRLSNGKTYRIEP